MEISLAKQIYNMFDNTSTVFSASQPYMLPYFREYFQIISILIHTWPIIVAFGMLYNTINIIVFVKSGIKDCVTILLLCLSVSDLCFLFLMMPGILVYSIAINAPNWNWQFDFTIIINLLYWSAFTMYDFSAYVSVFMGITRCACVALPLHFKSMFTKSRTILTILCLFISTIVMRIPVLTIHSIGIKLNPLTNQTYAYLVKHDSRTKTFVNDILNRTSLPWIAFIIMVACVIILGVKLIDASKDRQNSTSTSSTTNEKPGGYQSSKHKIAAKDIHVIQSVVLVCVIFILSQLPFLLYSTARRIYREFDEGGKFVFLFGISGLISMTCSFLNASVNIFIYFKYNSKYRSEVKSLIARK